MPNAAAKPVEVVEPIRRSVVILAIRIFLVLFIADTIYAALLLGIVLGYVPSDWATTYTVILWLAHTIKNIILTYLILKLVVDWISTVYYVNSGHLIRQRGTLNVTETLFSLSEVESVKMRQSWLGRMLNFGDVTVTFLVARNPQEVILYAIHNPRRYEQLFSTFV